jgi:hypothetical protein
LLTYLIKKDAENKLVYEKHSTQTTSLTLRSNDVLFSFAAPSIAGFVGISPKGRGMDAARR